MIKKSDLFLIAAAALVSFPLGTLNARGDATQPSVADPAATHPCVDLRNLHLFPYYVDENGNLQNDYVFLDAIERAVDTHDAANGASGTSGVTGPSGTASSTASAPASASAQPAAPAPALAGPSPSSGAFVSASSVPASAVTAQTGPTGAASGPHPASASAPASSSAPLPAPGAGASDTASAPDSSNHHGLPRVRHLGYFDPVPALPSHHAPVRPGHITLDPSSGAALNF